MQTIIEAIKATSLSKYILNDEQRFIMCFINLDSIFRVYQLHCQILLESNNQIYISELNSINGDLGYTLGMKNYYYQLIISIKLIK